MDNKIFYNSSYDLPSLPYSLFEVFLYSSRNPDCLSVLLFYGIIRQALPYFLTMKNTAKKHLLFCSFMV
jgi:hypothetical protein